VLDKTNPQTLNYTAKPVSAIEQFLISVQASAFRMARVSTSNTDDALELVQEAMLSLVKHYSDKPEAELKVLFYKILNNKITDWYRKTSLHNRFKVFFSKHDEAASDIEQYTDDLALDAFDLTHQSNQINQLVDALKQLSTRQRQCFLLRAWQGFSIKETASIMQCTEGSVKTHYSRATKHLQRLLHDEPQQPENRSLGVSDE
jgi:RNA polymerase sigma-70 factor, ECF subfamily